MSSLTFSLLNKVLERKKQPGTMVFTNGCFDIVHAGHIESFKFAKGLGTYLVVGINSDESIQKLKGADRPIVKLEHRVSLLEAIKYIDYVVVFEDNTPERMIQLLKPDILVKGAEYKVDQIVGNKLVKQVIQAPMIEGISTSLIIERIRACC